MSGIGGAARRVARRLLAVARDPLAAGRGLSRFADFAGGAERAILVAGSGRSGTTWIADVIARMTRARILFEPFVLDPRGGFLVLRDGDFTRSPATRPSQPYVRSSLGRSSSLWPQARRILAGRVGGRWVDRDGRLRPARARVVKAIRANLLLRWLLESLPGLRVVWVLRDPRAVVRSQMRMIERGWRFDWCPEDALAQEELRADWLMPFAAAMEKAGTLAERLAHKWCVETLVPLRQGVGEHPGVVQVRYEELCAGREAWERVRLGLGRGAWPEDELARAAGRQSSTAGGQHGGEADPAVSERVSEIVADYGLADLYPG